MELAQGGVGNDLGRPRHDVGRAGSVFGDHLHHHLSGHWKGAVPVAIEPPHDDLVALGPLDESVRPGSDRRPRIGVSHRVGDVGGDDRDPGKSHGKGGEDALQGEDHGEFVRDIDRRDHRNPGFPLRSARFCADGLVAELHILRGEGLVVVEGDSLSEGDGVCQAVVADLGQAGGELGDELTILVPCEQRLVGEPVDPLDRLRAPVERVDVRCGVGQDVDPQLLGSCARGGGGGR